MARRRVLVVEDDAAIREGMVDALEFEGYEPRWAADGLKGMDAALTAPVDLILLDLVDNACKYAADATDRTIHLQARQQGNRVVVCVRDHGPGIAREERRRLFQPFTKSAEEAAQSAPGVGLGLAISRSLARDMGGDLAWVDADGRGAALDLALRQA